MEEAEALCDQVVIVDLSRSVALDTSGSLTNSLASLQIPWQIAGGIAIDLVVGHKTREHGDLNILFSGDSQEANDLIPGIRVE